MAGAIPRAVSGLLTSVATVSSGHGAHAPSRSSAETVVLPTSTPTW